MRDFETDDELDALLCTALADRPEPRSTADLAARAMAMAGPSNAAAVVTQPARAPAWPLWLAVLAILGMVCFGLSRLSQIGLSSGNSSTDSFLADSATSDATLLFEIGLVVFIASVVWAVTRSAFEVSSNERTLTIA